MREVVFHVELGEEVIEKTVDVDDFINEEEKEDRIQELLEEWVETHVSYFWEYKE